MSNTSINLFTFNFNNSPVRTTEINNQIWFLANDVCSILEYKNSRRAIELHCDEWYNFVCSKEDLDSIRLLDENEDATVRFYGSNYNKDKQVDKESIKKIKEIIALYDMLTKYYTTNIS
jgi:hypothetical protein